MSRAYRIKVRESLRRTLRAHDRVSTQLELLEILPAEQMAQLLAEELKRRGFEDRRGALLRTARGVTVSVDPQSGTVTVDAKGAHEAALEGEKTGRAFDDFGPDAQQVEKQIREQLLRDLEKQAAKASAELQAEVTDRLERELGELRRELDQAVNRVTAEALKQKAAQLGRIKELTEDPQTGSLTIVVEV
jgi:nucleotide-binding universal stress UspA family protein